MKIHGFIEKIVRFVRDLDTALHPGAIFECGPATQRLLAKNPVVIADVGAAGGVDARFNAISSYCHFLQFEPQSETIISTSNSTVFPVALGKKPGTQTLNIARFSGSSSLYPLNRELLDDFVTRDCFEIVEAVPVRVDTLDHCLSSIPRARHPDFLKVDVEGAELDVFSGASDAMENVMGIRSEVSFAPRQIGAPLFGEVDACLRAKGFVLHVLNRELMIRHNQVHHPMSQPQCVWGDAIYFRSRKSLLEHSSKLPQPEREVFMAKFIILLCLHGLHDYATEILDVANQEQAISQPLADELRAACNNAHSKWSCFFRIVLGAWLALAVCAFSQPFASQRNNARFFLKKRWGYLFFFLWRTTARGGALNGSVSDTCV